MRTWLELVDYAPKLQNAMITNEDIARVAVYEHKIIDAVAGPPAWFRDALNTFLGVEPGQQLSLKDMIKEALNESLGGIRRHSAIDVRNLSDNDVKAYYVGYRGEAGRRNRDPAIRSVEDRRAAILVMLG
ncbi:hypothetical protein DXG01_014044 [Tephrocybe rancida]|nr:hypothetical protein DXG01_014044 [Tephrocybe rancida]